VKAFMISCVILSDVTDLFSKLSQYAVGSVQNLALSAPAVHCPNSPSAVAPITVVVFIMAVITISHGSPDRMLAAEWATAAGRTLGRDRACVRSGRRWGPGQATCPNTGPRAFSAGESRWSEKGPGQRKRKVPV
jgi:hypothetical protein